jgi:hypothetical protein
MTTSITPKSLSDEEFDDLVIKAYPREALNRKNACEQLNATQFDYCVRKAPGTALALPRTCARLTDNQFDDFLKKYPGTLQGHKHCRDRLTIYQRAWLENLFNSLEKRVVYSKA